MTFTLDTALASGAPRIGIFFRLHVNPVVRLWLGVGDCRTGIDARDGTGAVYHGLGEMLNLPAFSQLVNGAADRIDFSLNGVTRDVIQMASIEADEVKHATLLVGLGVFDTQWQLIQPPSWMRRLVVDYLAVSFDRTGDEAIHTVTLAARSFLTGRRRPSNAYFTDRDQQQRYAGDRFCERTVLYSFDADKTWPRF